MAIKKVSKSQYNLSSTEQKLCHGIIHSASASAAAIGAGLAQLPLADNAVITPIQITMIISLGKVFDQEITKSVAKGLFGGFIANLVGRGVAQAAWGWIPGVGNVSNAVTAATITESIGWLCVDHFFKQKYIMNMAVRDTTKQENSETTENTEGRIKECDELKKRANKFISGEKKPEEDKEEYLKLLDDFDKTLKRYNDPEDLIKCLGELNKIMKG